MKHKNQVYLVYALVIFAVMVQAATVRASFRFFDRKVVSRIESLQTEERMLQKVKERSTQIDKATRKSRESVHSSYKSLNKNSGRTIAQSVDYLSCIRSICSPSSQSFSRELTAATTQKIEPSIYELIESFAFRSSAPSKTGQSLVNKWMNLPKTLKSPDLARLSLPFLILRAFRLAEYENSAGGKVTIIQESTQKNLLPYFNKEQATYLTTSFQRVLDIYIEMLIKSLNPESALLVSGAVRSEHIKNVQVEIKKLLNNLDEQMKLAKNPDKHKKFIVSFKTGLQLSLKPEFASFKYFSDLRDWYLLARVANTVWDDPALSKFKVFETINVEGFRRLINTERIYSNSFLPADDRRRSTRAYSIASKCAEVLSYNVYFSPTKEELKNASAKISSIKNNFFSVLNRLFLSEKLDMASFTKNWVVNFPLSKDHQNVVFKQSLIDELKAMDEPVPDQLSDDEVFLFGQGLNEDSGTSVSELEFCELMRVDPLPDAALFKSRQIGIGPIVTKNIDQMQTVVYHEMAHLFEYQIIKEGTSEMKAKLFGAQNCLSAQQDNLKPGGMPSEIDKYLREDFADWLAEKVSAASKQRSFSHFFCYVIGDSNPRTVFNEDPLDSHSSHLFRAIHSYFVRNDKIPKVCSEALAKENADGGAFSKCSFE